MDRSALLIGLAAALAGTTAVFGVLGFVFSPVLLVAALPFAGATYVVWRHATGRLAIRRRERAHRIAGSRTGRTGEDPRPTDAAKIPPNQVAAARVLGVDPDAQAKEIRRAFREQARELHPDTPAGDEAAFRRARDAYEQLTED